MNAAWAIWNEQDIDLSIKNHLPVFTTHTDISNIVANWPVTGLSHSHRASWRQGHQASAIYPVCQSYLIGDELLHFGLENLSHCSFNKGKCVFVFCFICFLYYKRSSCGTFCSITLFWLLIWPKFSFTQISFFFFFLLDIYNRYSLFLQFLSQLQLSILLVYWLSIEKERKPFL